MVAECSTRSMPWRSGCWPIGVANVESRSVNGPLIAPSSSRSTRSSRGFDGLSASTSIVRPGRTAAANAPGLGAVDDGVLDAEAGARALHEGDRAGVDLALDDDVVAGRAQRQHRRGDGAHARPERQGVLGALQLGDGVLEGPHRRVGVAAVEVARPHPGRPLAGVVEPVGLPRAGAPQRGVEARALVPPSGRDRHGSLRTGGRRSRAAQVTRPSGQRPVPRPVVNGRTRSRNVRRHGHHWRKRNRHGRGIGDRCGVGSAAGRSAAPRSSIADLQEDKGKALADEIGGAFAKVDVTNTDDIINAVEMAKSIGPVRVLVNSAGIGWAQRTVGKDGTLRLGGQPRRVQEGHRDQPDRHVRLHPPRRHGDEHDRAAGVRRAGGDRQHRLRRRLRRPDRPGVATRRRRAASSA